MNFIYCLDKNYNTQVTLSLYTLNQVTNSNINVYIAHNKPESLKKILSNYRFDNLKLNFLEIKNNLVLPNLKNAHVSEATYYRIFGINLLEKDLTHITYIDSDILFNKDPVPLFKECINNLINSEFVISANTIGEYKTDNQETKDYFDYLEMNDKYFNAGVITYDLKKYREDNIGQKIEKHLINFTKNARYWDQDILNTFFNGKYLELPETLNHNVVTDNKLVNMDKVFESITIHLAGKTKPWHVGGFKYPVGNYFQEKYKEVFNKDYFISPYSKLRHLKEIIDYLKNKSEYKVNNFFKFLMICVLKFFKF